MQQVSSQLLWTLSGSGQSGSSGAVQSVEVELNGHPWLPPGSQGNPVQQKHQSKKVPPAGASSVYYYVDSAGYLTSRLGTDGKPSRIELIGGGYTQVAVSPDGRYLAALHDSTLYIGLVGGGLDEAGQRVRDDELGRQRRPVGGARRPGHHVPRRGDPQVSRLASWSPFP